MPARIFEAVERADEVGLNKIVGAAAVAGVDRGLRGTFEHQIGSRRLVKVAGTAHIAMDKFDPRLAQTRERQLAPATPQIVERRHRGTAFPPEENGQI